MDVEKLRKDLKQFADDNSIILLISKSRDYQRTNMEALRFLVKERNMPGIYVTINKPYKTIKNSIADSKIPLENIFFVDAISKEVGEVREDFDDVVFLDSPEDLTNLSITLSEIVDVMPDRDKFLMIDSMSSLTIYNHEDKVSKFARHIIGKMRKWNLNGIIMSVEEETDEKIISHFTQFCDRVIHVS